MVRIDCRVLIGLWRRDCFMITVLSFRSCIDALSACGTHEASLFFLFHPLSPTLEPPSHRLTVLFKYMHPALLGLVFIMISYLISSYFVHWACLDVWVLLSRKAGEPKVNTFIAWFDWYGHAYVTVDRFTGVPGKGLFF